MQRLLTPQTNPDLRSTIHATARHWRWIAAALLASLAVAAALQAAAGAVAGQVAIVILAGVAAALAWVLLPRDSGTIAGGDARARRCAVAWLLASALLVIIAPLAWVGLFMFLWPIGLLYGAAVRAYTSRCTLIRGSVQ
ncbi:MAG: hypothetical protein ABSG43_03475 [Solirubrobacteraceae bacterium]|jgi:hypothetical protein